MRFNVAYGAPAPREGVQPEEGGTLQGWGYIRMLPRRGYSRRVPCVSVFREAYDRTKPTEEGRASALRGRLVQSVDPTKLNNALAPRAAGRAEASLRALLLVLWRATRTGREKEVARFVRAFCASGGVSVRLAFTSARRYFRGIPPSCQSRRGYRSPGYMLPPDGRGYDKQGVH